MDRFRWNIILGGIIMSYGLFEAILSLSEERMVRVALATGLFLMGGTHLLTTVRYHDQ